MVRILEGRNTRESLDMWGALAFIAPEGLIDEERWWSFWIEKMDSEILEERSSAMRVLKGRIKIDSDLQHKVMIGLNDRVDEIRCAALFALEELVGRDAEVRQAVLGTLGSDNYYVLQSALSALSGLIGRDEEVRQSVLEKLEDKNPYVHQLALAALSRIVSTDAGVRQLVLEELRDENPFARQSALSALSEIVGTDAEVRQAVLKKLGDENHDVRRSALTSLKRAAGTDAEVRQMAIESLTDGIAGVRAAAVTALEHLFGRLAEVSQSIVSALSDQDFEVRLAAVKVIAGAPEFVEAGLLHQLHPWLMVDTEGYPLVYIEEVRGRLAALFGSRIPLNPSLRDGLLTMLRDPRWSARLGAALALLHWPSGPPDDVLERIFEALEDRRGLEAYPAQLTAASFLINQNDYAKSAIDLCLEALDYGTQTWEDLSNSGSIRRQAALVLSKLEPVYWDERVNEKLLQVMENDAELEVRDAAYGALVRLARIRDGMVDAAA
jgi:HEAT repeat protein